ncbi:MAG: hypothetical protein KDC84_04365 [Crocinitomicaceae bacterium]|nr:hypothetical protein [Crocinitomicaceae bacterium]
MDNSALLPIFDVTMKFFRNILAVVFALLMVASCTKEVIVPAGNAGNPSKKSGEAGTSVSVDVDSHGNGNGDVKDGHSDGDITDPENDLDFD